MAKDARGKLELGKRIQLAREYAHLSQADLAKELGLTRSSPSQWEGGATEPTPENLRRIAGRTGVNYEWLAMNKGEMLADWSETNAESANSTVPLKGWVVAGSEARYLPVTDEFDRVDAPAGTTERTVAFEIRGKSLGDLFDRWLVYFDDVRAPVTPDQIGRLCVVWLTDGRVLVKKLKRAGPGLYDLISNSDEPINGVAVEAAARVKLMAPR